MFIQYPSSRNRKQVHILFSNKIIKETSVSPVIKNAKTFPQDIFLHVQLAYKSQLSAVETCANVALEYKCVFVLQPM